MLHQNVESLQDARAPGTIADYLSIMRLDHAIKHVFIIPGIALALLLRADHNVLSVAGVVLTLLSCVLSASANYVINEWLDASFDAHHPSKSSRPCVARRLSGTIVVVEYVVLAALSLICAGAVAPLVTGTTVALLLSGLIYNVPPLRSKDHVFVDVLSESINNPIRMIFGWAMVDPTSLPPGSVLLAYWMGGAFLMNTKRLAEFREVTSKVGLSKLHEYRRSFRHYTEERLLLAGFLYAQISLVGLAVFMVKYRIEYLLAIPLLAALFCLYLHIGLKPQSTAQAPERLFGEHQLMLAVGIVALGFLILTFVDVPPLHGLVEAHYISIKW
ncbi:MAG TPA: UbiA family prenyltransferase [Hyphomicrobiaceae bacterium]|nr:UbiA family prenyltransferase [Hyphomicrobiaceae bacterium]